MLISLRFPYVQISMNFFLIFFHIFFGFFWFQSLKWILGDNWNQFFLVKIENMKSKCINIESVNYTTFILNHIT